MTMQTLQDFFLDQLRDLYDAENRIVKALPSDRVKG
jgi:ferritin-like metal-binding protein YciE